MTDEGDHDGGDGGAIRVNADMNIPPLGPWSISSGIGGVPSGEGKRGEDGALTFNVGETEVLRFDGDGCVYVRGEKVDDNVVVYIVFRQWLEVAARLPTPPGGNGGEAVV